MGTKKKICLIVRALLGLGGALPAAATEHETANDRPLSASAEVVLNAAPRITGLESVSFAENGQGVVATYSVRDAEGHAIEWSLSGRDAGAFTFTIDLDHHTMDLLFRSVPDYEHPLDVSPTDNDYQVTVGATDHGLPVLSTHYPVTVKIVNVDEDGPLRVEREPEHQTRWAHARASTGTGCAGGVGVFGGVVCGFRSGACDGGQASVQRLGADRL